MNETKPKKRLLTTRQLEFLAIGGTIGAGIFLGMGQGIRVAGPSMMLAYALAGMMLFVITRCLGEMTLQHACATPLLALTKQYIGEKTAFVQGWSYWACLILACMAELTAAGVFVHALVPAIPGWAVAAGALAPLFAVNRVRVGLFGQIEFWMALLKIATLVVFLVVGVALILYPSLDAAHGTAVGQLWRDGGVFPNGASGFFAALPMALFAFGGAELIGLAAPEAAHPHRAVPRAINRFFARILLFYIGAALVVICCFHWYAVPIDHSPIAAIFGRVGVPGAETLIIVVLVTAMLSACNSAVYASSRIVRSLADIGAAPQRLAVLNTHGSPEKALTLSIAVVAVTVLLNYLVPDMLFQLLLGMGALTIVIDWAIVLVAHLRFCKTHAHRAPIACRPPLSPWSNYAVLALISSVFLISAMEPRLRIALFLNMILFGGLTVIAHARYGSAPYAASH